MNIGFVVVFIIDFMSVEVFLGLGDVYMVVGKFFVSLGNLVIVSMYWNKSLEVFMKVFKFLVVGNFYSLYMLVILGFFY